MQIDSVCYIWMSCRDVTSLEMGGGVGCQSILFFVVLCRLILMKRVGGWEWTKHNGHIEHVYLIPTSYEYTSLPPTKSTAEQPRRGRTHDLLRQLYSEPSRFEPSFDCSPTICFGNYTPSSLSIDAAPGAGG